MITLPRVPDGSGGLREIRLESGPTWPRPTSALTVRRAFAAVHVVPDLEASGSQDTPAVLDWDSTLQFRHHMWSYGFGVAEAMDTAQRGMGLDWPTAAELIKRSGAEAASVGGMIVCGASTDQLVDPPSSLGMIADAYLEQVSTVREAGCGVVLMASRHLAAVAHGPEDYRSVYDRVLDEVDEPVVLHWLGPMFDPALEGYWGSRDLKQATEAFLELCTDRTDKIDGVKVSLLDAAHEVELRAALADVGVRIYTGDDFNYLELIKGDGKHHSDALLGALSIIAPAASAALQHLEHDDLGAYDDVLGPTVPLSRHVFAAPTQFYKTGVAFLAWLSGHQPGFTMVGGLQSGRSLGHLVTAAELAARAGLIPDAELAASRLGHLLAVHGVSP